MNKKKRKRKEKEGIQNRGRVVNNVNVKVKRGIGVKKSVVKGEEDGNGRRDIIKGITMGEGNRNKQ